MCTNFPQLYPAISYLPKQNAPIRIPQQIFSSYFACINYPQSYPAMPYWPTQNTIYIHRNQYYHWLFIVQTLHHYTPPRIIGQHKMLHTYTTTDILIKFSVYKLSTIIPRHTLLANKNSSNYTTTKFLIKSSVYKLSTILSRHAYLPIKNAAAHTTINILYKLCTIIPRHAVLATAKWPLFKPQPIFPSNLLCTNSPQSYPAIPYWQTQNALYLHDNINSNRIFCVQILTIIPRHAVLANAKCPLLIPQPIFSSNLLCTNSPQSYPAISYWRTQNAVYVYHNQYSYRISCVQNIHNHGPTCLIA